jgi:uncharacterized protein YbjT (DUF2867 family)
VTERTIVNDRSDPFVDRYTKPEIKSIVVFGAGGRMGRPVARRLLESRPTIRLRLVTSTPAKQAALAAEFPLAEVMIADYLDPAVIEAALRDMQGAFIVTPNFLDERKAMGNIVEAARSGQLVHIVRVLGDPPSITMDTVPETLQAYGGGTAVQHLVAREVLAASRLPVTYLNSAGWFMDNFITVLRAPIREWRQLIVPHDRWMMFIDPREIGEMAANILLSPNQLHIGQTYNLDNGHDLLTFKDVAVLMSEIFESPVAFDGDPDSFLEKCGAAVNTAWGGDHAARYFVDCFKFEQDHETSWRKSDIGFYLLGRAPLTLRDWLTEHKHHFQG